VNWFPLRAASAAEESGFSILAVLVLSVGIGDNTAVFTVADALRVD